MRTTVSLAAIAFTVLAGPALASAASEPGFDAAAESDASPEASMEAGDVPTVVVTGERLDYGSAATARSTKTDTPLIDVPQTIQVVTREQLNDQAQHSLGEVLRYVPGASVGQGEGNRDQVTLRGQNTSADFFLDGVRDDVQYFRSLYNVERVEILKGPTALLFGRGGGGGVVNRVQKTPSLQGLSGALATSLNSFDAWDVAGDLNVPFSATGAVRLNAFHEQLDNHRDAFTGTRHAFNPQVAFAPAQGWRLVLSYEDVHDDRVADRGVPALACVQPCTPEPLRGHGDTFFGVPGINRTAVDARILMARLEAELSPSLSWSTSVLQGDYDKYYTNVYANGAATAPSGLVALAAYTDRTVRDNRIAQTNLVWDGKILGVGNKVLFGLEAGRQASTNVRRDGVLSVRTLDLANITYPSVAFPVANRDTVSTVKFTAVYLQDEIAITQKLDLVLGLRFDRFDLVGTDRAANPQRPFARVDEKVTPRLGLVYQPGDHLSFYVSRSQSFLPRSGDQFLALSTVQQNLAPEQFTNREAGVKWNVSPELAATFAVFQLDRTNATTPDPLNPALSINVGGTRTRGVELGLSGRVTANWQMSGGYALQQARLRGNDTVALAQVPGQQWSLWNRYDVNERFGLGLGVVHQGSQFAAIRVSPTTTRLPGFTRVDAAAYYHFSDRVQLQANVENLLDANYFADAHNNNNVTPGAPLNARLSLHMSF
jgi:catecholate siderophore receptor